MQKHRLLLFFLFITSNVVVIVLVSVGKLALDNEEEEELCSRVECDRMEDFKLFKGARYYPAPALLTPPPGWSIVPKVEKKYFEEAPGIPHASIKYFNSTTFFDHSFRMWRVREMFIAWAAFADAHRLPYWIAHGTLIGYYFNTKILPWDDDMDLQMTYGDLVALAKYNQTWINDEFLIDVNPYIQYRVYMDYNVIDARIVDKQTGAFMDITGIAVVKRSVFGKPVYGCKSPHYYYYTDLFPLHRSIFEDAPTWRPHNIEKLLKDEYGFRVLTKYEFHDHRWNGSVWEYVPPKKKG